jgi:DNA-directed RNA polymerase specialized sigma24 family protein
VSKRFLSELTVRAARAGDRGAQDDVVRFYRHMVFLEVRQHLRRFPQAAEDARLEANMAVLRALKAWQPHGGRSLDNFVKLCVRNALVSVIRGLRRRRREERLLESVCTDPHWGCGSGSEALGQLEALLRLRARTPAMQSVAYAALMESVGGPEQVVQLHLQRLCALARGENASDVACGMGLTRKQAEQLQRDLASLLT